MPSNPEEERMFFRYSYIITPFLANLNDSESQRERIRLIKILLQQAKAIDIAFPLSNSSVFPGQGSFHRNCFILLKYSQPIPSAHDSAKRNGLF